VTRERDEHFGDAVILERVEEAAALGDRRAASLLPLMVEERQQAGRLHLFSRLAARPLLGDIHHHQRRPHG
jgi:hypothetical protein